MWPCTIQELCDAGITLHSLHWTVDMRCTVVYYHCHHFTCICSMYKST